VYFDTPHIAQFYFNEPESGQIRQLVRKADAIRSSLWASAEFHAVLHRYVRESAISPGDARDLARAFPQHVEDGLWSFIPVSEALLRRTSARLLAAPRGLFLRTADAVHLTTAQDVGEEEVWTNDRQMLAAAGYFGLKGRSV
jgi:predicted nucleic acid-binding protein